MEWAGKNLGTSYGVKLTVISYLEFTFYSL